MFTSDYGYSSSYGSGVGSTLGFVGGFFIIFAIIGLVSIVFAILGIIGQWKAFEKAGKKGWECLIAGHSQFVTLQFGGVNPIWVLFLLLSPVMSIVPLVGFLAVLAVVIYFQYLLGISTAKSFGKSIGFGVGLAIPVSAPIFWFLLGKKDVRYVGPQPANDFVMGWFKKEPAAAQPNPYTGNGGFTEIQPVVNPQPVPPIAPVAPVAPVEPVQTAPATPVTKFCTSCGYKVANDEKFCPSCGKAV